MRNDQSPLVGIIMGSDSDWPKIEAVSAALDDFGVLGGDFTLPVFISAVCFALFVGPLPKVRVRPHARIQQTAVCGSCEGTSGCESLRAIPF